MESSTIKVSPLDFMSAIIKGSMDPSNVSADSSVAEVATMFFENREFVMVLTTSVAILIGCVVVLVLRRSGGQKSKSVAASVPKPLVVKEVEPEPDDGQKRVTILYGTQTGTAEGFAKV